MVERQVGGKEGVERERERETDRQTDRQTDRKTERDRDRDREKKKNKKKKKKKTEIEIIDRSPGHKFNQSRNLRRQPQENTKPVCTRFAAVLISGC